LVGKVSFFCIGEVFFTFCTPIGGVKMAGLFEIMMRSLLQLGVSLWSFEVPVVVP